LTAQREQCLQITAPMLRRKHNGGQTTFWNSEWKAKPTSGNRSLSPFARSKRIEPRANERISRQSAASSSESAASSHAPLTVEKQFKETDSLSKLLVETHALRLALTADRIEVWTRRG
jgi:hypothetical protein